MEVWHIWVIVALVFFIVEIFTSGFAVACFSFGALAAAVASACGLALVWQLVFFIVVTALAFVFVRPLIMKTFYKGSEKKTNADALIGRTGRVSQAIDPAAGKGRVAIDGDDWKAESEDGAPIEAGAQVEVVGRESVIIKVKRI